MKKRKSIGFGAVALCVGVFGVAGCNNQVMGQRDYVPADQDVPAGYQDDQVVPMQQSPRQTAPVRRPAPRQAAPIQYTPMEKLTSSPVTSVPKQGKGGADAPAAKGETTHVIKAGDNVSRLAVRYGVSASAIMQANNLDEAKARRLRIGQKLVIPGSSGAAKNAEQGKDKGALPAGGAKISLNADGTYTVQSGDFPGKIARKLGVKESELMAANNLTSESAKRLQIGQKLIVPGKGGVAPVVATQPPATAPASQPTAPQDELEVELDKTLSGTEVPPTETQPATTADTPSASTATTPPDSADTGEASDTVSEEMTLMNITEDTTIEEFAAKYNTTVEKLKALNPGGMIPADGKLPAGRMLFVPVQK